MWCLTTKRLMARENLFLSGLIESTCQNKFINAFINNYVLMFRSYCDLTYSISISGLGNFLPNQDNNFCYLMEMLKEYGFIIKFVDNAETVETLQITYISSSNSTIQQLECNIGNLISIINLSSKTGIPTIGIIIMKIVSRLICQSKIMYKAIVLDLDDTLWAGTLSEDGKVVISNRMRTKDGLPFISFMQFVRVMADELGIFVTLCSRNNLEDVKDAIDYMDEQTFPLKGHIDYIAANYNDKSANINQIANKLSILPNAVVFIDDNCVVRDEVKCNIPKAFVPEWTSHEELITMLTICCAFDRYELSLNSRNRKRQFGIIQAERERNVLPSLYVKVRDDMQHKEAIKLYAKSNQFKLVAQPLVNLNNVRSLIFDIHRANGESLGVCSAITYAESDECTILNWAISCRYFEIGLEEFIILYMLERIKGKRICFAHQKRKESGKVNELLQKYYGKCIIDDIDSFAADAENFVNGFNGHFKELLSQLRSAQEPFRVYWFNYDEILRNNTHIQLYE